MTRLMGSVERLKLLVPIQVLEHGPLLPAWLQRWLIQAYARALCIQPVGVTVRSKILNGDPARFLTRRSQMKPTGNQKTSGLIMTGWQLTGHKGNQEDKRAQFSESATRFLFVWHLPVKGFADKNLEEAKKIILIPTT